MNDYTVKRVNNQKLIFVKKAPCNKAKLYATINLQALDNAAKVLNTPAGLALYIYLAKNQQDYTLALSNTAFKNWCGFGKTAYNSAVAELIEKGFLVHKEGFDKDSYEFRDYGNIEIKDTHPTAQLKVDNGFHF